MNCFDFAATNARQQGDIAFREAFDKVMPMTKRFVGRQIGEALRSNGGDLYAKQVKRGSEPTAENATTSLPGATPGVCRGCDRCTLPPNAGLDGRRERKV